MVATRLAASSTANRNTLPRPRWECSDKRCAKVRANPTKRMRLINKIKESCSRNGSGMVVLFCDEAQR